MDKKEFWDFTKEAPIVEAATQYVTTGKALDLGAGEGRNALYLSNIGFNVTAVDINKEFIKTLRSENRNNIHVVQSDILNYETRQHFDYIVCNMVLHFLKSDEVPKMVKKMQKITENGGINVIGVYTDKNEPGKRPYLFKPDELKNFYEGWEILSYQEKPTLWFQMPGEDKPRRNQAAYLIARKGKYSSAG